MSVDVSRLDPANIAPTIVVDRNPKADEVGHGRTLPLIGNARPHTFDVAFDDGTKRVYADTAAHALGAIIDGYEAVGVRSFEASQDIEDRDLRDEDVPDEDRRAAVELFADAWEARYVHADAVRLRVQKAENERARQDGSWEKLGSEEQFVLTDAERAESVPFGVRTLVTIETGDPFGGPSSALVERGIWETSLVRLALNRGDYGFYNPEGTPEPVSTMTTRLGEGDAARDVVITTEFPANLIILDPGDDESYLYSLERAGLIEITLRPTELPDEVYTNALRLGEELIAENPELGDYGQAAGLGIVEDGEADEHHSHLHLVSDDDPT